VTLTGHVGNFAEKRAAEAAVSRVGGVKAVVENIEVKLPYAMKRTDEQIAAAVLERLAWDVVVPKDRVKVKVENGWITLSGDVDWNFEKEAAEDACRRMLGVVSVLNQIAIKPQVNAFNIHEKIMIALHRSWYEPVKIKVTADGGKVRLTGSVRTWYERQEAETAAWGAPGVTMVDDAIVID
jgi:osmotically-inducible protein OsmY